MKISIADILSLDGESWCPASRPLHPELLGKFMSVAVEIYSICTDMWSEAKNGKYKVDSAKFLGELMQCTISV